MYLCIMRLYIRVAEKMTLPIETLACVGREWSASRSARALSEYLSLLRAIIK